jgi:hypothetical protein
VAKGAPRGAAPEYSIFNDLRLYLFVAVGADPREIDERFSLFWASREMMTYKGDE